MVPSRAPIDPVLLEPALREFRESYTLPGLAYTSTELFDWEMRHFFEASWVCLGRSDGLLEPGSRRAVQVGGESILLVRDEAGLLRGFFNVCRHRGHELLPVGGSARAAVIQCPYHGWAYHADGSLKSAPRLGLRPGFNVGEHGLTPVRIQEWRGWVFVNVSGDAPRLDQYLGNFDEVIAPWDPDDMVEVGRMDYVVEGNWKLIHENFQECYHCPEIHPELCLVSPPSSGANLDATGLWIGGWMDLAEDAVTMSLTGNGGAPQLSGLLPEQRHRVYYFGLFPNLLISPHPDYVLSHRIEPLAPGRSRVECRALFPREVAQRAGFDGSYASDFWDLTNKQDWAAIESVQRSASSRGFRPGPIAEAEEAVFQFFNMIAAGYLSGRIGQPRNPQVKADRSLARPR
jgi:glycine betaine catabolism A